MKRAMPVFLFSALTVAAVLAAARASSAPTHDRPPGVATASWIQIDHGFGAVVDRRMPDRYSDGRPLPSAQGYFVVWHDGHWLRLDSLLLHPRLLRSPTAASKWISLDRNLRFVIKRQTSGQPMRDQAATPSALGYFAIKRRGQWLRLAPDPQGALYRGPLRPNSTTDWLPISNSLRFVIEQRAPERDAATGQPSVLGYFVGKHDGRWVRLSSAA